MSKRKLSPIEANSAPVSLPAAAEAEWRLSYKFADSFPLVRLSFGAGLIVLIALATRIW